MKIFLGVAGVMALVGLCFASLSIYAKKEINKPKFEYPELIAEEPVSALPTTKEAAFEYIEKLYNGSITADDVELSQHTDAHFPAEERVTPFSDTDNELFSRVLDNAQGALGALYPVDTSVRVNELENAPQLGFTKADVIGFTATRGYTDEGGNEVDDGCYYITLTVKPESIDTKKMLEGEVLKNVEKELSSALTVKSLDITPVGFTASFKIVYGSDMLIWSEFRHNVKLIAEVDFTEDYKALSAETAKLEIPYETVQSVDLFHYGVHFTERQLAVNKSDMKALPLEVRVNAETTKDDYKMTYSVSEDGILDIDKDGVMNVDGVSGKPLTVTATLEYDGHTYTDTLIVYATELEVKTDE